MASLRPKHIAIIDDEMHLRESLKDLLETAGYFSDLYESADHFLREEGYRSVACILADVRMPGTSGIQLLKILEDVPNCPPTLIMTSYADEQTRLLALASGAAAFLPKPIDSRLLFEGIEKAIKDWITRRGE